MARRPVQRSGGTVLLRPAASPVDTFVQPAPSPLRGFAEALGKITPELDAFLKGRDAEQAEKDKLLGEAAFYKNNSMEYSEAVRQGKIPAQSSPGFMRSYKQAQGNVGGSRLEDKFWQDYEAWDGKYADDADFDDYLTGWVADNIGSDDPDVLRGLLPHVRTIQQNGRTKFTSDRNDFLTDGHLNASIAASNRLLDESEAGRVAGLDVDYGAVFGEVAAQRATFVAAGGRPEKFDKALIEAMSAKVLSQRNPELLKFFDQKIPGQDITYGEDAYGAIVKKNTVDALEVVARRVVNETDERQRKADAAAKDEAHRRTVELLAQDPTAPLPDDLMATGQKYDPTFRVRVEEWRKSLGAGQSDPYKIKAVYARILEGGENSYKIVQDAFDAGVFGKPEDLTAAWSFAKSFEDNQDRLDDALGSSVSKSFLDAIDVRTKGKTKLFDPIAGMSNEGYEATYDFRRMVQEWILENPKATLMQREEAINKIGKMILDRIEPGDILEAGTYERPSGEKFDNPFTAGASKQAASLRPFKPGEAIQNSDGSTSTGATTIWQLHTGEWVNVPSLWMGPNGPVRFDPSDEAGIMEAMQEHEAASGAKLPRYASRGDAFLGDLTEAQRGVLEDHARRSGVSVETFVDQMLKGTGKAPPPAPERGTQSGSLVKPISYQAGAGGRVIQPRAGLANLVSNDKRGYTPDLKNLKPAVQQGVVALQQAWGKELPIVSGYRSPTRNRKAGGAKGSQHMHGNAVDIDVSGLSRQERVRLIKMASEQGFTGIGVYANSIHLDYGGRRAWGPSHGSDSVPSWAKGVIAEHAARQDGGKWAGPKPISRETAAAFLQEAALEAPMDTTWKGSATIAGDPTATRLANLVKQYEADGNYNAVYGNSSFNQPLDALTVNQVLSMQAMALASGEKSSAVGGYQFLRKTLRSLKQEMGLTGKERFTTELQDRMFLTLLNRRGYQQYKAGKLSERQFALRLSQEWAALPNPNTGRSYYSGDGLNKSRVTAGAVYRALGFTGAAADGST